MPRDKRKILFNKNHIKVERIDNLVGKPREWYQCGLDQRSFSNSYTISHQGPRGRGKPIYKEVTCESPLGFYYTKTVAVETVFDTPKKNEKRQDGIVITLTLPRSVTTITYLTSYGSNIVQSTEDSLRPWEVCPEDSSMSDHFISDLFQVFEDFFKLAEGEGIIQTKYKKSLGEYRSDVYCQVFGNRKGPRHQTDEEKILAHGFDLKESFRKPKENGK